MSSGAVDAIRSPELQWLNADASATLQCNVDRPAALPLTILPTIL
jgi:hypothetical protein